MLPSIIRFEFSRTFFLNFIALSAIQLRQCCIGFVTNLSTKNREQKILGYCSYWNTCFCYNFISILKFVSKDRFRSYFCCQLYNGKKRQLKFGRLFAYFFGLPPPYFVMCKWLFLESFNDASIFWSSDFSMKNCKIRITFTRHSNPYAMY